MWLSSVSWPWVPECNIWEWESMLSMPFHPGTSQSLCPHETRHYPTPRLTFTLWITPLTVWLSLQPFSPSLIHIPAGGNWGSPHVFWYLHYALGSVLGNRTPCDFPDGCTILEEIDYLRKWTILPAGKQRHVQHKLEKNQWEMISR